MTYDLLVVGGGIHGVAVARDAALRGLRVLLAERGDLASGTSSRSSKLVHGGIRYLETGQFRHVREALRERALLLSLAPYHVRPLRFLLPHYRGEGRSRWAVSLGLALYAALAGRHPLAEHETLGSSEALALEPSLRPEGLVGASRFWDAQVDDASLCVAIAVDAERAGADVRTYTEVRAMRREAGSWIASLRDAETGAEEEIAVKLVVNAAGPWVETVRALAGCPPRALVRRTRGTHVVLPALTREHALLLTARRDGRVFFILPWGCHSLVGTTDVDDPSAPERVGPTAEDVRYLLEETARAVPASRGKPPERAFAGVRALARGRAALPWANSREHRIEEEEGMLTLIGGKYTTHRRLAERVVDRAAALLHAETGPCRTASAPIGPERSEAIAVLGSRYPEVKRLSDGSEITQAEIVHAVLGERARHVEDVLLRRTRLWLSATRMREAAEPVSVWMAPHRGWSEEARAREVRRLHDRLEQEGALCAREEDR